MAAILLSAGHGGGDPGAISPSGLREAELALKLRDALARVLRQRGAVVWLDGDDGVNEPLRKALALATRNAHGVSVEFHFNVGPAPATGIECYSFESKRPLAQRLAKAIADVTRLPLRGDGGWRSPVESRLKRLAFCQAGGLVLEVCFLSNVEDMRRYLMGFEEIVSGLAEVLLATIGSRPGPRATEPLPIVLGAPFEPETAESGPEFLRARDYGWRLLRVVFGSDVLTTVLGFVAAVAAWLGAPNKFTALCGAALAALGQLTNEVKK